MTDMKKEKGIKTENLNIGYDSDLIRDITLSVQPGSIVTLIGPNGCGKTTLLKTLTGALKERGGVILLNGDDRSKLSAAETAMSEAVSFSAATCRSAMPNFFMIFSSVHSGNSKARSALVSTFSGRL